jgi:hypothetical protein
MERSTIFNGKSTINGPFPIATLNYQRVFPTRNKVQSCDQNRLENAAATKPLGSGVASILWWSTNQEVPGLVNIPKTMENHHF